MQTPSADFVSSALRQAILECFAAPAPASFFDGAPSSTQASSWDVDPVAHFNSPAAEAVKQEIISAGRKLWERQYVDGNGGNISARVSDHYVICTPTLCSKGDLTVDDLSLVDLNNRQICGSRAHTSEILLHLEIYKEVAAAQAVIHCHPPYATAHAVAGIVPRGNLVPEQEVFVGPVALAPYETPGTMPFARTILPFVHEHNTILLSNHGVVCWADTVTHAEWYAEVLENYCKIVVIANQLGAPIREIPEEKIAGLMAMKKRLGLPDPRLTAEYASLARNPSHAEHTVSEADGAAIGSADQCIRLSKEIDELVARLTPQVLALIEKSE